MTINHWPLVYMLVMGGIGALGAYRFRGFSWAGLAARLLTGVMIAGTLALHFLTNWILVVDPLRDSGNIPLSTPLPSVTSALLLVFIVPGLLGQGVLLGSLARPGKNAVSAIWKAGYVATAAYSVWVLPWALGIIVD